MIVLEGRKWQMTRVVKATILYNTYNTNVAYYNHCFQSEQKKVKSTKIVRGIHLLTFSSPVEIHN